jgi:beta-glucanase (GH16 family)
MEYFEDGSVRHDIRPYATPMLQTWNKFCFTEGVLEMSAQLPGIVTQPGLWPAFWVMGNLGRATAGKSTDRIWPFSYSHCPSAEDEEANQFPIEQQEINACREKSWTDKYGLNEGQGRGAIELDIVEAMPGTLLYDYKTWKSDLGHCPTLPEEEYSG